MDYTKQQLRESLGQARLAMPKNVRQTKGNAIAERLLQVIDWSEAASIHCFEPIMRLGEVDLVDFVVALQTDREDIKVYTSRKIDGDWRVVLADTDQQPVTVPKFDVVIVPMLGFDASLQRVGYGGGYYDRFLADQPQAKKIGVCYEAGKIERLPSESHDIPLDFIVTDKAIYSRYT